MPLVRRGLPNRRDYLTLPSAAEFLQAASRITGAPAAQLASQSHVVPREFAERENAARPPPLVRRQDSHADLDRPRRNGSATTPGTLPNKSAPEDSTQSRQTALKALRLTGGPGGVVPVAKSRYSRPG